MKLEEKIVNVIVEHMKENPNEYINPNMLVNIENALYDYTGIENDELNELISDMWGM